MLNPLAQPPKSKVVEQLTSEDAATAERRSELETPTFRPNHQKHGIKFSKRRFLQSPLEPVFGS